MVINNINLAKLLIIYQVSIIFYNFSQFLNKESLLKHIFFTEREDKERHQRIIIYIIIVIFCYTCMFIRTIYTYYIATSYKIEKFRYLDNQFLN